MPGFAISFLLYAASLLLMLPAFGCVPDNQPTAHSGVLDLAKWKFGESGPVALNGEWEFYRNQGLEPRDFRGPRPPNPSGYVVLPEYWDSPEANGGSPASPEFTTIRLKVLMDEHARNLAMHLTYPGAVYKLWVNGSILSESVSPQNDEADHISQANLVSDFHHDGGPIEIILQVGRNAVRPGGGVKPSIVLGQPKDLAAGQSLKHGVAFAFAGGLLVMGVYHLALFWFRKSNRPPLYFGYYCLIWMGYYLFSDSSDWAIKILFPQVSSLIAEVLADDCIIVSVPVGLMFFKSLYPREFSSTVSGVSTALAAAFTIGSLLMPVSLFSYVVPGYYVVAIVLILYSLMRLHAAWRRKREGAAFILVGFLFLGAVGVNDMLVDSGLIRSVFLFPAGMTVFVLCQAFALALRFSNAFSDVERLSLDLKGKSVALTNEMAERARLECEIVNTSEEERRRISHEIHDGLCQQLTGARLRCCVLERELTAEGSLVPGLRQLSDLLNEAVDHAYDLSHGLWPMEHEQMLGKPSLEATVRRLLKSSAIPIKLRQDIGCATCASSQMVQIFRMAQEAIANAVKHSQATSISVELCCTQAAGISLAVIDNGQGRKPGNCAPGGLGLRIMAYRAHVAGGKIEISDTPGGGTTVACTAPCQHSRSRLQSG